jgi:hypothetical protein
MTTYTEQQESDIVELFMLNEDDRDERLKAHYRQGKIVDGKWVNYKEEEEERCGTCDRYAYHENDWHCSQGKEKEEEEELKCDCGVKLLICDSGMKLCSVGCKDRWVNSKGEPVEEEEEASMAGV